MDYTDVFSKKSTKELLEYFKINKHSINLEPDKQLPYEPIYSLGSVELETLKTYIEINLANSFIHLSKFPTGAPIFFGRKPDGSFYLCVNYWILINLKIKNWYSFLLIRKSLNWLSYTK